LKALLLQLMLILDNKLKDLVINLYKIIVMIG